MGRLLCVDDLRVRFQRARPGRWAVDGVSFSLDEGEILGLVGESGSGKTVTAMSISGLLPRRLVEVEGSIILAGKELLQKRPRSAAASPWPGGSSSGVTRPSCARSRAATCRWSFRSP